MRRQQRKFPGTNILAKTEHVTPASTANRVRLFARVAELGITSSMSLCSLSSSCRRCAGTCQGPTFGNAELLAEVLRVAPGSVTPFALLNDTKTRVTVVMDAALTSFAEINCHPMENTATTRVATEDMLRFIRACGHEPLVLALS